MTFFEAVKKVRKESDLTQIAFAEVLGVSFATINRWENGVQAPSKMAQKLMYEFCRVIGLNFTFENSSL